MVHLIAVNPPIDAYLQGGRGMYTMYYRDMSLGMYYQVNHCEENTGPEPYKIWFRTSGGGYPRELFARIDGFCSPVYYWPDYVLPEPVENPNNGPTVFVPQIDDKNKNNPLSKARRIAPMSGLVVGAELLLIDGEELEVRG
jgi:hypothetical protein